jgi:hypothetical protein
MTSRPTHRITCTRKTDRYDYESILTISGPDGTWTKADAANRIDRGTDTFYTAEDGSVALLIAETGRRGRYVRTKPDCTPANNLLNLKDC